MTHMLAHEYGKRICMLLCLLICGVAQLTSPIDNCVLINISKTTFVVSAETRNGNAILVGNNHVALYSLLYNRIEWKALLSARPSSRSITSRHYLFCPLENGELYCIDIETGLINWSWIEESKIDQIALSPDGNILVFNRNGVLQHLDASSSVVLRSCSMPSRASTSIICTDNLMLYGGRDKYFYCADIYTSSVIWKIESGNHDISDPIVLDGIVYFATTGGILYCVDISSGNVQWQFSIETPPNSVGIVLATADSLLLEGAHETIYCIGLKPKPHHLWDFSIPQTRVGVPFMRGGNFLIFELIEHSDQCGLVNIDLYSRKVLWKIDFTRWPHVSNQLLFDRFLLVSDGNNILHVIDIRQGIVQNTLDVWSEHLYQLIIPN